MPSLSAKANFPRGHDYDSALSAPRKASEYYGITRQGKRWKARILRSARLGLDSKQLDLGSYPTELEAARAVDLYIHEHMPSLSAKANFPAGHVYGSVGAHFLVEVLRRESLPQGQMASPNPPRQETRLRSAQDEEHRHLRQAAQAVDAYIYANVPKAIPKVNFPRDD